MREVAEIIRLHGAAYRAHVGGRLLPSQARVLRDLAGCRTAYFGGALTRCDHCDAPVYRYHSCRNRHCPTCHRDRTDRWLDTQQAQLLPCPYYLVTFTLPASLRALAFAHQRVVYGVLMRSAAEALQRLAADPRYVGARLGALAVLHTWTRAMLYHPHVHLLVTAGGLSSDGTQWIAPKNPAFLVPVHALSVIFRAKVCDGLRRAGLLDQAVPSTWTTPWVVHAQPAGRGTRVLEYLGRYVFRIAIANSRLEAIDDERVTFRYQDNRTHDTKRVTLSGVEFLQRFLQHVLPRGCAKVRYYGLWSAAHRADLARARARLTALAIAITPPPIDGARSTASPGDRDRCPHCRVGTLVLVVVLRPAWRAPPGSLGAVRGPVALHSLRRVNVSGVVSAVTLALAFPGPHNRSGFAVRRRHPSRRTPRTHVVSPSGHEFQTHTRDKISIRNARARISSNPGLCRGSARHESFIR